MIYRSLSIQIIPIYILIDDIVPKKNRKEKKRKTLIIDF